MKYQEIYDEIVSQLSENTCERHGNGYFTWVISGHYYDSEGNKREVKATTHDEDFAEGWRSDPEDRGVYAEYQRKWAEFLVDELELVNQY